MIVTIDGPTSLKKVGEEWGRLAAEAVRQVRLGWVQRSLSDAGLTIACFCYPFSVIFELRNLNEDRVEILRTLGESDGEKM